MNPLAWARSAGPSSRVRRAAVVLAGLLLVAAVVPFVVFAVPQVVGADHGFVILSGSMEPTLSPGDVVIVAATADVGAGDIVTFDDGNAVPTTHRVVGTQDGQFVTKGDANEEPDSRLVAREDLVGHVVLAIPLVGHVILWANTPTGYVTLVLAPLALLAVTELHSWARRGDEQGADGGDGEAGAGDEDTADADDDTADAPATAAGPEENADADPDTEPPVSGASTVAVAVPDLKLTLLASASLLAYAGWNVYREVTTLAAPDPVSVGALTAGLLGLLFATWVTVGAWHRARDAAADESGATPNPRTAETDGGTDADSGSSDADGPDSADGANGADTEADR